MLSKLLKRLTRKRFGARQVSARRAAFHYGRFGGLQIESLERRDLLTSLIVEIAEASISENGGITSAIVSRDSGTDGDLVVNLASSNVDEATVPPTVMIFDGQDSTSFRITAVDEQIVDLSKTISITATADNFDPASDTIDITNDDSAKLSVSDATVVEGDEGTTILSFPVALSLPADVDVSVDYTTQDGTASAADGDYVAVATPATFTIDAGGTSGTIDIEVNADTTVEIDETLSLLLSNLKASGRVISLNQEWIQLGQNVNGQVEQGLFGSAVSLSGDGRTLVVGAPGSDRFRTAAGQVRAYRFDGRVWAQLGQDIVGDRRFEETGAAVSVSNDGNTLAIGTRNANNGRVRVYRMDAGNWTQLGQDIEGENFRDYFGWSLSVDGGGNTIAIGAIGNNGNGLDSGHASIYRFDGTTWIQLGRDIDGKVSGDQAGRSLSMSDDGQTVAIGAPFNDATGDAAGQTRVYRFAGGTWTQLGQDINGEAAHDRSSSSVSLSGDGDILAIGAPQNAGAGHVRVYAFDGSNWSQLGQDIDGQGAGDQFGTSVSLSHDGNVLSVGATFADGKDMSSGHARTYQFDGARWIQIGMDISGESGRDEFGTAVSLADDGSTLAIGAPNNDDYVINAGRVQVFRLGAVGTINNDDRSLTIQDARAIEGEDMTFAVTLNTATPGGFTVDVVLDDVTANGAAAPVNYPDDYDNVVTQLSFFGTPGETRKFLVPILDDAVVEVAETFIVSLIASDPLINDGDTATGTIVDNDLATMSIGPAIVTESNDGTALLSFPVALDAPVDVNVSVDYTTQDGTASAADYVAVATPVTFTINSGDTFGAVNVIVKGDKTIEPDETLSLILNNLQARGRNVSLGSAKWNQRGQDIDGESATDLSGWSVSQSGDANTIAVGAILADSKGGEDSGHVRIYRFDGTIWAQIGQDIDAELSREEIGTSISLSDAGDTIAIGSPNYYGKGQVRAYRFDGSNWLQLGDGIDGKGRFDHFGASVSLGDDGNTLAIGIPRSEDYGPDSGQASVYRFDGVNWNQLGQDINGKATNGTSGSSVSLSGDGNTLAIGAPSYFYGQTFVYRFDGTDWMQLGQDINAEVDRDGFGGSVSVSRDGNTLVIGAIGYASDPGIARIYRFDGTIWNQLGQDIQGEGNSDEFGEAVSLSDSGNVLAIGAPFNDGMGRDAGHVRVYRLDGADWIQLGQDIDGEASGDGSGWSVSLRGDGSTVAIGAPFNGATNSGHTRVYWLQAVTMGTIIDSQSLVVEFSQQTGMDFESSGDGLPQLLVTGTIEEGHRVTINVAVTGGTARGGYADFSEPKTVTIPAGAYNATPIPIPRLSIRPDALIESNETIILGSLTGSQIEVGDANGDGTIQDTTTYTIVDDDLPRVQTAVELAKPSVLKIADTVSGGTSNQLVLTVVDDNLVISDANNILGNFTDNTTGNETAVPLTSLESIEIDLASGDDHVSIDFSNAPQDLSLAVTIHGG